MGTISYLCKLSNSYSVFAGLSCRHLTNSINQGVLRSDVAQQTKTTSNGLGQPQPAWLGTCQCGLSEACPYLDEKTHKGRLHIRLDKTGVHVSTNLHI